MDTSLFSHSTPKKNQSQNQNQPRIPPTSRILNLPSSDETITITSYFHSDGTVKNLEATLSLLALFNSDLNSTFLSTEILDETKIYALSVTGSSKVELVEYSRDGNGRMDFDSECVIKELSSAELACLKDMVVMKVAEIFELFESYYNKRDIAAQENGIPEANPHMITLLRLSGNAKLRFLEELFGLYIGLNCQTYFDTLAYFMMIGTFTLPALLSVTGLQYAKSHKLRGRELLKGAIRKDFSALGRQWNRGEIHTISGLSFAYMRQLK